jgi:hypothetical protein
MAIKHILPTSLAGILTILVLSTSPMIFAQVIDPPEAIVDTTDADRFVALLEQTDGSPTAAQLERFHFNRGHIRRL